MSDDRPGTEAAAGAWRDILLYGQKTATYKLALATVLQGLAQRGQADVSMTDLSAAFLDAYVERLTDGQPQGSDPNQPTVMERIVDDLTDGSLSYDRAVDQTRREGFRYVLDAFHRIPGDPVSLRFYERAGDRFVVTDDAMALLSAKNAGDLAAEVDGRWSLLESGFAMSRSLDRLRLICDERAFYVADEAAPARNAPVRAVTPVAAALHGYEAGWCLYCGELVAADAPIGHVLRTVAVPANAVWNLTVAHPECEAANRITLPTTDLVARLSERNERLIASHRPLRGVITGSIGITAAARRKALRGAYDSAMIEVRRGWRPGGGHGGAFAPGPWQF